LKMKKNFYSFRPSLKRVITTFLIALSFTGCEKDSGLNPHILIPDNKELTEFINYEMIAVDTIRVYSANDANIDNKYFSRIIISNKNKYFEYVPLDTITPVYQKNAQGYLMVFSEKIVVPDLSQAYCQLDFKFMLNDKEFRFADLRIDLFKYDFAAAELYFDLENQSCGNQSGFIQGFDIDQGNLYFHVSSVSGVYKYSNSNHFCNQVVVDYLSGDWLCTNNGELYIDLSHCAIIQINIDSLESSPILVQDKDWDILGMDIYNDIFYVLSYLNKQYTLSSFDLDGSLLSSEPFDYPGWAVTVYENYLYTIVHDSVARFNLLSKEFEFVKLKPGVFMESIQVIDGLFYYADFRKHIICYLPLSEVFEN